jgi:hypothetical protein
MVSNLLQSSGKKRRGNDLYLRGYTTTLQLGHLRKGPERCWYRETPCKEM